MDAETFKNILNNVYTERNTLLALLCDLMYKHGLSFDVERWIDDKAQDGWQNIIAVFYCGKWLTWHIPNKDLPLFEWVVLAESKYDGHTTNQKYQFIVENLNSYV